MMAEIARITLKMPRARIVACRAVIWVLLLLPGDWRVRFVNEVMIPWARRGIKVKR